MTNTTQTTTVSPRTEVTQTSFSVPEAHAAVDSKESLSENPNNQAHLAKVHTASQPANPKAKITNKTEHLLDSKATDQCPECKESQLHQKTPSHMITSMVVASICLFPLGLFFLFGIKNQRNECRRCGFKEKKLFRIFYLCFGLLFIFPYLLMLHGASQAN